MHESKKFRKSIVIKLKILEIERPFGELLDIALKVEKIY